MWENVLFAIGCLVLPVIWGVVVNWLFVRWRDRNQNAKYTVTHIEDPDYLDFQI